MSGLFALIFILHPLAFAIFSQVNRRHYGVAWFAAILVMDIAMALFWDNAITSDPRWILDAEYRRTLNTPGHDIAAMLMTFIPPTIIGLVALFSLPKGREHVALVDHDNIHSGPSDSAAEEKTCPQCAEMVKAAAKMCRFCRYEFPS